MLFRSKWYLACLLLLGAALVFSIVNGYQAWTRSDALYEFLVENLEWALGRVAVGEMLASESDTGLYDEYLSQLACATTDLLQAVLGAADEGLREAIDTFESGLRDASLSASERRDIADRWRREVRDTIDTTPRHRLAPAIRARLKATLGGGGEVMSP